MCTPPVFSELCNSDKASYDRYTVLFAAYLNGFSRGEIAVDFSTGKYGCIGDSRRKVGLLCGDGGDVGAGVGNSSVDGQSCGGECKGWFGLSGIGSHEVVGSDGLPSGSTWRVGSVLGSGGDGDKEVGEVDDGKACVEKESETVIDKSVVSGAGSGKKKKMGKRQKDRAKVKAAGGIGGDNWRRSVVVGPVVVEKSVEKSEARVSLEEKWVVENRVSIAKAKLAEEKAKKDLEFQRARDVDAEVRKSRARIMRETESSKVATEKAFASLKASGNVPGFCATVVSDGPGLTDGSSPECTISPDSSASMHEFRAAQKQVLDLQKEVKDLTRQLRLGKLMLGEEVTFTAKSDGDASEELTRALDELENERFYVDRSEDPACFGVNKTIYAKRMYIDTHSYDGDY